MPQEPFEELIGNDPVVSARALRLIADRGIEASELINLIEKKFKLIEVSPTARHRLAQLCGLLSRSVVTSLIDCIKSGRSETKLVAAQCMRFITDSDARSTAVREMHSLLDGNELTLVEAAMEALGNLGAVTSGPRISNVAESDSARRTIPYALKALLRLIPAENMCDFVHLRFGDFNKVFSKLYDSGPNSSLAQLELDRISSLSQLKTVLPELRGRVDGRTIDLIMHTWVNSPLHDLRILGANALATLRIARVRYAIENRIDHLLRNGDEKDTSIMHLAFAWGNIGANPSWAILQRWYESGEDRRSQCARIALSLSFPALMADPKTRDNDFLGRFAKDQLERDGNELQAHILLGLALTETEQNSDVFLKKLGSTDVITRAAAAIGLAMRLGAAAEGALKEYLRGIHPTSFDRIMAVSAMSRFDAAYTKQLHQALCSMAPLNVWRIRHGIEPRLFDPYRWTAEVITALRRTKRGGASRARAWAEVLMFDDSPEIIELPPSDTELITRTPDPDHPNIRDLYKRMDSAFQSQDYAGVLHASANVFETLAKLIFADPNVENQTLGGIFEGYRKRSKLPSKILDFIEEVYKRRNTEPNAAHGATQLPSIDKKEAAVLIEMTKAIARSEYW